MNDVQYPGDQPCLPQGNFMFDPETQRLAQMLPGQFWTESATAVTATALTLAGVVTFVARRQARSRAARRPHLRDRTTAYGNYTDVVACAPPWVVG